MKRTMIVVIVMVILLGIPGKAVAGSWNGVLGNTRHSSGLGLGGLRSHGIGNLRDVFGSGLGGRGSWNGVLGNTRRGFGRYGFKGTSTFGKIEVGGSLVNQILVNDRVLKMAERRQDRILSMAERDQQIRTQGGTVLVTRGPITYQVLVQQVETKPEKTQSQELQQDSSKIISELKVKSPKAYQVYLDQKFADQSQEISLKKALEILKEEDKNAYYALLEQMYEN